MATLSAHSDTPLRDYLALGDQSSHKRSLGPESTGKNESGGWLSSAVADCYKTVTDAAKDPVVDAVVAVAVVGGGLALGRRALFRAGSRAVEDATSSTGGLKLSGVVARDDAGTGFVFNEKALRPAVPGAAAKPELQSIESHTATAEGGYSASWIGKDGARYGIKSADVQDTSWHKIYESEFPAEERQPYEFLQALATKDAVPQVTLQLTERDGKTTAFSMLSDYGEGSEGRRLLLPYIGVEKDFQGIGIGSKHLGEMVANTKAAYPTAKGMAIEVEDPSVPGLAAKDLEQRMQRVNFYVNRHGATLLDNKYLIPSSEEGGTPLQARMLWLDFGRGGASDRSMHSLISSIYKHGYQLEEGDPVVKEVLGKYSD